MFEHLSKLEIQKDRTRKYSLHELGEGVALEVAPAMQSNKGYYNALLKSSSKLETGAKTRRGVDVDIADVADKTRNDERQLYGEYVVIGWCGICNSQGEEVPFSREAAMELMQKLPDYMFDRLRVFCAQPANWTEEAFDTETVAGN